MGMAHLAHPLRPFEVDFSLHVGHTTHLGRWHWRHDLRSSWISMGSLSQTSIWLTLRGLSNALRRISCACHIVWKGCDDALWPCIQYAACTKRISQRIIIIIIIIENMIQYMTSHKLWLVQSQRQFNFRQRSGFASNRGNSMLCCSSRSGSFLQQAMSC